MQEKDIRKQLNQELDEMAPDILSKILEKPIEPIQNEKELLGRNKPLFQERKISPKHILAPMLLTVAACIAIFILMVQPETYLKNRPMQKKIAFSITIDVNPSIKIDVKKDGTVKKVTATNKSAKNIVKNISKKITNTTTYNEAVEITVKKLDKSGYLKSDKSSMLMSVVSMDEKVGKEKLEDIKKSSKKFQREENIKSTTVYQYCTETKRIVKTAEKYDISLGKAALCLKLAKKEKTSVKQMCESNINTLVEKVRVSAVPMVDEIAIGEDVILTEEESTTVCEEITMCETESTMETISYPEEITTENVEWDTSEETENTSTKAVNIKPTAENETEQQATAKSTYKALP